ncbi:MAG: tetratricopeptide repeat protein, partial [Treponema sp.]
LYVLKVIVKYGGLRQVMKNIRFKVEKIIFFSLAFVILQTSLYSVSFFDEGKAFLALNRPDKAIMSFNRAFNEAEYPKDIYLYLGVAYLKLGMYVQAIENFAKGKNKDVANFYIYSFNMGNAFFAQNRFYDAEISYNEALSSGVSYPEAILNRANARMKLERYAFALEDYKKYLELLPDDEQAPEIRRMIEVLELVKKEEDAEKARILQEATRLAEESMRKAEEERQRKLLEEINSSLSSVKGADSLSSGTEDTINYEEENDLD